MMTGQSDLWVARCERARRPFQAGSDLRGEPMLPEQTEKQPKAGQEPSA
jgi:hypothetical protein